MDIRDMTSPIREVFLEGTIQEALRCMGDGKVKQATEG